MRSLDRLAVGLFALGLGIGAAAQITTSASCTTDTWTFNKEQQSPCLVAAALEGACNAGTYNIPKLETGLQYTGPLAGFSTSCTCSTVTFSMVSACGACQGGSIATWDQWKFNCTPSDITISNYPLQIPNNVAVPHWAYLDVTTTGVWDSTSAFNDANSGAAESTGSASPTTISRGASSLPGSSPTPSAFGSSSGSSGSSTSKKSNAGPIAGGVVGGLAAIALIGVACFFIFRRRRHTAPSAQFVGGRHGEKVDLVGAPTPSPAPGMGMMASPYNAGFHSPLAHEEPLRPYDPSDPSTFPTMAGYSGPVPAGYTSPAPSAPYSQTSGPGTYGQPGNAQPGQHGYSGVAEV